MCPGRARSEAWDVGAAATSIVLARSAALIPVETPVVASIEIVKGRPVGIGVVRRLHRQVQPVADLSRHRRADQTSPFLGHEVHGLRRDLVSEHGEVALVLAVRVIDEDDHAPLLQVFDDLGDGGDGHGGAGPVADSGGDLTGLLASHPRSRWAPTRPLSLWIRCDLCPAPSHWRRADVDAEPSNIPNIDTPRARRVLGHRSELVERWVEFGEKLGEGHINNIT